VLKKTIMIIVAVLVITMTGLAFLGFTPLFLYHTPGVATGIGAKLACSSKFVSGLSEKQAFEDIVDYSPILANLKLSFNDSERSVTASFFGIWSTVATYRPGLGCALDYPGYTVRDNVDPPVLEPSDDPWPKGERVATIEPARQQVVERILERDNAAGLDTRALLVVQDGRIVAEAYGPGFGPESRLLGWSMGKSITSIFIGHLVHQGKLSLSDNRLFDEWAGDQRGGITLSHLLTMTDGLDFSEVYDPGHDATTMLFLEPDMAAYTVGLKSSYPPGTHFNYSSGTANILSRLVLQHTGGNLQSSLDYIAENIYRPMGISHALFEVDAAGTPVGSSYFYASARDWARAGLLMLNNGVINDHRILSEAYVQQAATPNTSENEKRYGFQFWLNRGGQKLRWPDLPEDTFAAQGNREQRVMIIPSKQTVIVRLGWTKGRYPTNRNFTEILETL
jgi:CubicO group peptidase (beta-lactamase class C family)